MARRYKRRRISRRRSRNYRSRRRYGGRRFTRRFRKKLNSRIHFYKRATIYNSIAPDPVTGVYNQGYSFALNDVTNYAELTPIYDQYKICAVKIHFLPLWNRSTQPVGAVASDGLNDSGMFFWAIDYDDDSPPTGYPQLQEYSTYGWRNGNLPVKIFIKPKFQSLAYIDGTAVGDSPRRGWIDCAYSNVPHFGLKVSLNQIPATMSNLRYRIQVTYFLAFKNQR